MFLKTSMADLNSSSVDVCEADANTVYKGAVLEITWMSILAAFGIPGNALILRVYWMKKHKTTTHILIMGLAVADLMASITLIGFIMRIGLILAGKQVPEKWSYIAIGLNDALMGVTVGITACIAADRYDCICRPQKRWLNPRRAKIILLVVVVTAVAAEAPHLVCIIIQSNAVTAIYGMAIQAAGFVLALLMIGLCYGKVYATIRRHVRVGISNSTHRASHDRLADANATSRLQIEENTPRRRQKRIVWTAPDSSLDSPNCGALSVCSSTQPHPRPKPCKTISGECSARDIAHKRPTNAKLHRKTTRMLFVTSLVFILTWLPSWIALAILYSGSIQDKNVACVLLNLVSYTYLMNNVLNPLIYGLANRCFRDDCKRELHKLYTLCRC